MEQIQETETCNYCLSKFCKESNDGDFDICQYGVSYINLKEKIITREAKISVSTIAKNLRHEINPILQSIIEQTSKLDHNLSTKIIDLSNPLSLIIGNTVILDNFIQMITGIHDFHSTSTNISNKKINLSSTVDYYYDVYSIIKEESRNETLCLKNLIPNNLYINELSDFIKYMIVILIDNAWKYSINNSDLKISVSQVKEQYYNVEFCNISSIIPQDFNIFKLGNKVFENSKGFGYGLYWIIMLKETFNQLNGVDNDYPLDIIHQQEVIDKYTAKQKFIIKNLKLNSN